MTIVAIVKCKNGYIAMVEERRAFAETDWKPDTAHVFTEYADLVDFLYKLFAVEEKPA